MPYITQDRRSHLDIPIAILDTLNTSGELNYLCTELCKAYVLNKGTSYEAYNSVIGALEACKLEFYRRMVAPYEDIKVKTNGDVYLTNGND